MGQTPVGKGSDNDQLRAGKRCGIIAAVLFLVQLSLVSGGFALSEYEAFEKGYQNYLAYQPAMAVDSFRQFLAEFPRSSAGDAALFWLGRSLVRTNAHDEAEKAFIRIKKEFAESPLVPYAEKELRDLGNGPSRYETAGEPARGAVSGPKQADGGKKSEEVERHPSNEGSETRKLEALLEEERKKSGDMRTRIAEFEKSEAENRKLLETREAEQRNAVAAMERDRARLREEKEKLDAERRSMAQEPRTAVSEAARKSEGETPRPGYDSPAVKIGAETYSERQVINTMISSSSAMAKAGIRDVPWRSGDFLDDFVNEQVLYREAQRAKTDAGAARVNELAAKFRLDAEETEYLGRYLVIADLVDKKMKSIPEERVVESLTVDYTQGDQQGKVALATELQEQARGGKTFGEIAAAYPGKVRFMVMRFQELQGWVKDRIEMLKDGEISVVWTKEGYMVLMPMTKRPSYGPFEDEKTGRKNEVRAFVRAWTEELRRGIKDIEILRTAR